MSASSKRQYFDQLAPRWDSTQGPDAQARAGQILDRLGELPASGWVLDAGCGTGVLVSVLRERLSPACLILEVDFAEQMLRLNACAHAGPRVFHLCADVERLPLAPGSLALVICYGLYPHLERPAAALREMLRALRRGGMLAIAHSMSSEELNAFHRAIGGPVSADRLPPAGELALLLRQMGAEEVRAEEEPGLYLVRGSKAGS
ncbi:MAG: class I SAM-dependent methyltransferase [Bryobacterales bacterium]|nr:methyltransferase domain-containing protein [Bryobacteraceae bacterium]MDW8131050.1 class I SAM-dependent methyltransferase [Bryobacterales bacterium]